jgi:hypothetical protein
MGYRGLSRLVLAALAGLAALALVVFAAGCGSNTQTGTSSSSAVTQDTGGKLLLTEKTYDFGNTPVGTKVEHAFAIRNTGTGPLQLGQLQVKRLEGC